MAAAAGDEDDLKFIECSASVVVKKVALWVSFVGVRGIRIQGLPARVDESPSPFTCLLVGWEIAAEAGGVIRHALMDVLNVKKCKYNVSECILI